MIKIIVEVNIPEPKHKTECVACDDIYVITLTKIVYFLGIRIFSKESILLPDQPIDNKHYSVIIK